MRKNQPKGLEKSPSGDDAPVSSGRPVVNEEIQTYADSVRTRLGIFTPAGRKGDKSLKKLKLGGLEERKKDSTGSEDNAASAAKRQKIVDEMLSGLDEILESPKPDFRKKVGVLKKALMSLDPEDLETGRGKIQFLIRTCVPNIKVERLNVLAQSIITLITEGRQMDSILHEIVSSYPQSNMVPDLIRSESHYRGGQMDMTEPTAGEAMGVAFVGPNPDKPSTGLDAKEEADFAGMEMGQEVESDHGLKLEG